MANILVVEDDAALRSMIVMVLRKAGHEVSEASDGRPVTPHLEGGALDLIISDINMPEMDGLEVVMKVRELAPHMPVLAMSGGGRLPAQLLLENARHLGAVRVLTKPFSREDLLASVEAALGSGPTS